MFLHILLLLLLCVAVRVVSCCLCNGAVVSYGGKCTAPLHMRLFQPHIYNMTNLSKNKNHFFKGARASPGASGERHEIIQPSFGPTYNMLKNSESVTLFCKKNHPGFHRGNTSKETNNNRRGYLKKGIFMCVFIVIGSRLHIICGIIASIDYRPAAR